MNMALIGYTPGGSPIFYNCGDGFKRKKSQPRYRCCSCHHRTTKNQAKKNGGKCHQCKDWLRAFKPKD